MRLPRWLTIAGWAGVALLAAAAVFSQFGAVCWWCDLFAHFKLHYAIGALAIAVAASILCRRRLAAAALALAVVNGVPLAQLGMIEAHARHDAAITIYSHNLLVDRSDPTDAFEASLAADPDIILFQEFRDAFEPWMGSAFAAYPYQARTPHWQLPGYKAHGIVVLSRLPITNVRTFLTTPDAPKPFGFRFDVALGGRSVTLFAVHLSRTMYAGEARLRRMENARLREVLAAEPEPGRVALIGDMNATPFSAVFDEVFPSTGPFRRAGGYPSPTWPAVLGPFGIPIDHAVVGDELAADVTVMDAAGSDHRALLVRLSSRVRPGP